MKNPESLLSLFNSRIDVFQLLQADAGVSIGDLVKSIIDDQRFTIAQLEDYIHGELRHH